MLHSYLSPFICDRYSSGSDLLCSAVLLGHVGEDLLLLCIFIQLLALLLQLLALLLLLQGAPPGHTEEKQPSLKALRPWELTASRACLSFSLSARTLCCSALSARRFSWRWDHCCWTWRCFDGLVVLWGLSLSLALKIWRGILQMWLHLFCVKGIKTQYLPAKWEKNKSVESSKHIWGDVLHAAQKDSHDSIDEGDELLFLLLPLDEVSFDQRLQLRQILLHALPVDVLSQTNTVN